MPEFAKHIEVVREGRSGFALRVDGEEFPWYVAEAITCETQRDGMPSIKIELFADQVDVHDRPWPGITAPPAATSDPTGRLARAEAARDQAEELLAKAHKALEENHATIEELREQLGAAEKGPSVGEAYVEVRPDFTAFQRAIDRLNAGKD